MTLRFAFRCSLFAGTYFLNTGLTGEVDGTQTYLHRLVDALAFRVLPDAAVSPSGYVDFDVAAEMSPHARDTALLAAPRGSAVGPSGRPFGTDG